MQRQRERCNPFSPAQTNSSSPDLLVQPEILLPSQMYAAFANQSVRSGVGRLMCAVLEDAITAIQHGQRSDAVYAHKRAEEAIEWFASDDEKYLFSFVNVCAALGLTPSYIRKQVARLYRQRECGSPQKSRRTVNV
ncbi:MAG: hypothetical protein AB7G75_07930 [Candidatus Binatia bacterium]